MARIIAHRGGGLEAPENSYTALAHTRAAGVSWMETDVHITADGAVVLLHDPHVDRVLDGHGMLSELTWREVSQMRDAAGDPPVLLLDALKEFPELRFIVDAKCDAVAGPLARIARAHPERFFLASFCDARLGYMAKIAPHTRFSAGQIIVGQLFGLSHLPLSAAVRLAKLDPGIRRASGVQVPEVYGKIRVLTDRFITLCHALGLRVDVWTVNDDVDICRLAGSTIDGIITDRPRRALELLA
ncbi:MAG: glycerophosphodiester phosphodiesterase family protein [Bowdeniella nasicola]|nr:glycerophosphodiester phosphodiesterase family protein [Bowdeniella nasicola]